VPPQASLQLELPATLVFDYPSVAAITTYVRSRQPRAPEPAARASEAGSASGSDDTEGGAPGGGPVAARLRRPRAALAAVRGAAPRQEALAVAAFACRTGGGNAVLSLAGRDASRVVPHERWCSDDVVQVGCGAAGGLGHAAWAVATCASLWPRVPWLRPQPNTHTPSSPQLQLFGGAPVRFGVFLPEVDAFDAAAFGVSAPEAALMDPQQRLLLEAAAEVLLAAPRAQRGAGAVGAYVGVSSMDYNKLSVKFTGGVTQFTSTGASLSVAAGRLSYTFGLRGPAVSVDTACSSSLVAAHSAAGALALGQCASAAVGGVNLTLSPDTPAAFAKAGAWHVGRRRGLYACWPGSRPTAVNLCTRPPPLAPAPQACWRPTAAARRSTPLPTATCVQRP
jgi:hypothetical protein